MGKKPTPPHEIDVGPVAGHYISCPACSSSSVDEIIYGEPGPELMEAHERGEIVLGGCMLGEQSPAWHCRACEREFGTLGEERPEMFRGKEQKSDG